MRGCNDIRAWRKTQRAELVARRATIGQEQRGPWNERVTELLWRGFPITAGMVVGFCWPFKGEFDARFVIRRWREQGATAALPEVVAKGEPLQFRKWWPGAPMTPGVYDIPVPAGTDILIPDIAIVPMNGFDEGGYRLGYGGGYFDRTLAAFDRRILAVGVSFEMLRLPTIYPQVHDVPMDFVVTEAAVHASEGGKLIPLAAEQSRSRAARILQSRRLPRSGALSAETPGLSSPPCYAGEFPGYWGEDPKPGE
ncbi:MAG: 5-formyltetrahydrofolate cyclo-ligase [Burkholderiales bacterium]|nr:5-formyltetrahydrofolate cyclo-ligase [Burkholderiales bacterium]